MQSQAASVPEYLDGLPEDRRTSIEAVRKVIRKHLPKGYQEVMQYGMIGYVVPLKLYPNGYLNDKKTPLPYAALGSQKNYMSVYLMTVYGDTATAVEFREAFAAAGKKLNMGKSCVRFKKAEDLALDAIGKAIASCPVEQYIAICEQARRK